MIFTGHNFCVPCKPRNNLIPWAVVPTLKIWMGDEKLDDGRLCRIIRTRWFDDDVKPTQRTTVTVPDAYGYFVSNVRIIDDDDGEWAFIDDLAIDEIPPEKLRELRDALTAKIPAGASIVCMYRTYRYMRAYVRYNDGICRRYYAVGTWWTHASAIPAT